MTTSLTYNDIQLGYSPQAAEDETTGEATQEDITQWIADGDLDVEIRTGTTTESSKRNLLIKEYVKARYKEHAMLWLAKGGQRLSGLINADLSLDPWATYLRLVKDWNNSQENGTFVGEGYTYAEE